MKQAEADFKARLAVKQEEERAANALAADAARFTIGPALVSQKGVPSSMEAAVVQALLAAFAVYLYIDTLGAPRVCMEKGYCFRGDRPGWSLNSALLEA